MYNLRKECILMIYSCIDIGGTAIKFGLVDETGRFHKKGSLPTEAATGGGPGIVHKVRSLIQRQLADHPLAGIGISTAASSTRKEGLSTTPIHPGLYGDGLEIALGK